MFKLTFRVALISFVLAKFASAALDPQALAAAAAYSKSHNGASLLVLQAGKTLAADGADEPRKIFSGTKAFWCLAGLAAAQDGLLNLDERVGDSIPSWKNEPRKARITIRQLLDFSGGLDPGFRLHNDDPGDRDAIAIGLPLLANPGSAFIYGPSSLQVFHAVLKSKLHGESPHQYLERRVLRPFGLGPQRYLLDRAGNPLLASGWLLSARQWSRLGAFVLSDASVAAQVRRGSSANAAYSLGWWNNRAAPGGREFAFEEALTPKWSAQNWNRACICRDAPNDLLLCVGSLHQRLYVIPSLNLIVVRHGSGGTFSDARFLRLLLGRER